ncbi:hypothetical protein [Bacillus sp. OV322]|uniref:hypothetical protein n=1 Tax=Bacillus sp. OV322 TaxID=1882764 RepID=UPI0015A60C17|nr:hypothetical protein [Bacillus sp. OV322]
MKALLTIVVFFILVVYYIGFYLFVYKKGKSQEPGKQNHSDQLAKKRQKLEHINSSAICLFLVFQQNRLKCKQIPKPCLAFNGKPGDIKGMRK